MANWKYSVDIRNIWQDEEMFIGEKGKAVAAELRRVFPSSWLDWKSENYDEELDHIVQAFENITGYDDMSPVDEFDGWMSVLYDYGDAEVAPFGQMPPNKMAWIATIF